jgi:serine/threonine protein kinase
MPCAHGSGNWVFGDLMLAVTERFQFLEKIGSGGEGESWLALDKNTHKTVVCKKMRQPELSDASGGSDPAGRVTLVESLLSDARRGHPAAKVQLFASAQGSWSVCSYIEGISLETLSSHESGFVLGLGMVLEILYQLLVEIDALHRHSVMHGDITPANVVIGFDGDVTLIDFGQSARFGTRSSAWGAPGFIAPERLREGVAASADSDVFSVGCLLYWLVTGSVPDVLSNERVAVDLIVPQTTEPLCPVKQSLLDLAARLTCLDPHDRMSVGAAIRAVRMMQQDVPLGDRESLAALVASKT